MKLSLKRFFGRSKTGGPEMAAARAPSPPRAPGRQTLFVALSLGLALLGAAAAVSFFSMEPVTLKVAVGPPNSDDLKVVQTLTQAFAQSRSSVRLKLVPTEGAEASADALATDKVDLAVVRGDLDVPKNAQAVATLRKNVAVIWVPPAVKAKGKRSAGAKITKISQLAGHRIGVIGSTEANVALLKVILQQYGLAPGKIDIVQLPAAEAAQDIRDKKADAYLAAGPVNSKITAEAIAASSKDDDPTFLAIDSAETIAQNHPVYASTEIPAGAFGGSPARPDDEVKTIGFSHHLVARKGLSDTTVAELTRQVFAARQQVMSEFPLVAKIETPDTDKDAVLPAHPGAAAFINGEEKTFLDKYSDYIWWSLMAMSAMGSLGAWLAGYLKRDERGYNDHLRVRLFEMIELARSSASIADLDALQSEADSILRDTLHCFEDGAIQVGALTAFNIVLDQFHHSVADRKLVLATMSQNLRAAGAQMRVTGSL